jgi:predicted polyphosphate/ATP-dependent NAD kinase
MAPGGIGIIANPASGKDVRRLVARASVFDNAEKRAIVRRALTGIAAAAGNCPVSYFDDAHGIVRGALADAGGFPVAQAVAVPATGQARDTTAAARALGEAGCSVVLTLGGDGTNRAVVRGWQDAPLIAISTGTNNVFPSLLEATVAGAAAGLVAAGLIPLEAVAVRHKLITVTIAGEEDDLALIDAVLTSDRFVGARALLEPDRLRTVLLTRAEPAAIGMTALGGLLEPVGGAEDHGLLIDVRGSASMARVSELRSEAAAPTDAGVTLNVPMAPGHYREVNIDGWRRLSFDDVVEVEGPGVLALDGERERPLGPGQRARLRLGRDGPWVIDVAAVLRLAAERGLFRLAQETHSVSS